MIRKSSLYSLIFTIFNDSLGWGVILTLFAPLLFDPASPLLTPETSMTTRNFILGALIASYPFTQFLFMPILGSISDRLGRRIVLQWTIFLDVLCFVLSGISIYLGSLQLLFISRILAGIFSANSAAAQAAIADISSEKDKAKNLSLSGIAGGLAWVVGPPLGGFLSSKEYLSWADYATPMWFTAILFFINYLWVSKSYQETYTKKDLSKHNWKQEIKDFIKLSKIPKMNVWLFITFFFFFGWGFCVLFYPALLVQRFDFNQSEIGLMSGYQALFWLLSSTLLNRGLAEKFKPEAFILFGLPITAFCMMVLAFTPHIFWWYILFPVLSLCGAAIWINITALLSNLAGRDNQGKVFGLAQSLMSLAMFVSPLISGFLGAISESAPLATSGIFLILVSAMASFYCFRKKTPTSQS
ncbi:MAG TPA: MFS transporter [Chlamydiales bacterium]|nr:MFS transporter [Chlamydiales bacterium]